MAEILKEWLRETLQLPITWEAEEFGHLMKNGHVVADILLNYHLINDEQFSYIKNSNTAHDIKKNWNYLVPWLQEISVNVTEADLDNIMIGRGSTLLRLFYSMFLNIDRKDRVDFIKQERQMVSNLIQKVSAMKRFIGPKVEAENEQEVNLSRPLLNNRSVMEWQKKKAMEMRDFHDYVTNRYYKMLARIDKKACKPKQMRFKQGPPSPTVKTAMQEFAKKYPYTFINYPYEKLIELEQEQEDKSTLIDTEWVQNYMNDLHIKIAEQEQAEELHKHMPGMFSESLWDMPEAEEESMVDEELCKKILKLSLYEKQMCAQIMEVKQQARDVSEKRIEADAKYEEERDRQFNEHLDNLKEQIKLEEAGMSYEKRRQILMHNFLYGEKMKRKRRHYYEICYETMLSIIDFAVKYEYYKQLFEEDIPEHFIHKLKNIYFKKQPIYDVMVSSMEELVEEELLEEDTIPEEEEIIRLDLDRQEVLNVYEIDQYMNYCGPWALDTLIPNFETESEERRYEYLGGRVLGHVVFSLLEIKYPYPPARPPADIPLYPSRAVVRCVPDRTMSTAIQTLLTYKNIFLTRLESAIRYCLKFFQTEMIGCLEIELTYDKFIQATADEAMKELIRSVKAEEELISKANETPPPPVNMPLPSNAKQTQTPKTIPEEDIKLSDAAELGRYAYEALSFGEPMTDHLISAMLVEYIKNQIDINGFVIINYPNTYKEAKILEETFSGREPPEVEAMMDDSDDIYLEETIVKHRKKEKDIHKEARASKLVINPHTRVADQPFESYFTTYVHLRQTPDMWLEEFIWDLKEENSEMIDRFYAILGLNYSMYYETIEKDFLGLLCRYIIGELQLPWNTYDDLFGLDVLALLDFTPADDKGKKAKGLKSEPSSTKMKEKRDSVAESKHSNIEHQNSGVDLVTSTMTGLQGELTSAATVFIEEKLIPGEEFWEYGSLPIIEAIGKTLASCWEQIEKSYLNDMEQLLLSKQMQINCVIPYTQFIKYKMEQVLALPYCSCKQELITVFLDKYNEFKDNRKVTKKAKSDWHCRIKDLQMRLYHICDDMKLYAEQQRQALIRENWAMEELTTLANTYISMMQTEINRTILTCQVIYDFYVMQLKRYPNQDRLQSKELAKINRETDDSTRVTKASTDNDVFGQIRSAFMKLLLENIELDFCNNPFNLVLNYNYQASLDIVNELDEHFVEVITKERTDVDKIVILINENNDEGKPTDNISPEEYQKTNAIKCIEEWTMAVNGELCRAKLRLHALQRKCYLDMKSFNDLVFKTFSETRQRINSYYMNELTAVDRLCKYIQLAIEDDRDIPENLALEQDQFVIDPHILQIPVEQAAIDSEVVIENVPEIYFKISQLAQLRSQFQICGPTGFVSYKSFLYLLQDFICHGKDNVEDQLVPEELISLDPEQVPQLIVQLFGKTVYVDWRDFLIVCCNVRYPNVEELLVLRTQFRCKDLESTELISRDDYLQINLWFEHIFDPDDRYATLKKVLLKNFLFELFETAPDVMNYPAFLLAFCRGKTPVDGFTNALSMAVGQKTCYHLEYCLDKVCKLVEDKRYRDACRACALECADKFITELINNVINFCEGTFLEDIVFVPQETIDADDKKGGKKKGKGKGKEKDVAENSKGLKSGTEKSKLLMEAEVKQTNIGPVGPDETEEEKPSMVIEEQEVVLSAVELLEYTVSQSVIWNILKICLPWYFVVPETNPTPYVNDVTEVLKRLENDTDNGDIYVCKFISDPIICKLLHKVRRFTIISLAEEVQKILLQPTTR